MNTTVSIVPKTIEDLKQSQREAHQTMAHKIIQQLLSIPGLKIECPHCTEKFPIKKAKLFSTYGTYPHTQKGAAIAT
jgi:hypothetical protein